MALFTDDARVEENLANVLRGAAQAPAVSGLGAVAFAIRSAQDTRYVVVDFANGHVTTGDAAGGSEVTMMIEGYLVHELFAGHIPVITTLAYGGMAITGDPAGAIRLLAALPAISGAYRDHLDPDGLPEPMGPSHVTADHLPEGLPFSLRDNLEDRMLLIAIALSGMTPVERSVQIAVLFEASERENLTSRHLARLLISLADLSAGNSDHEHQRQEQEAERNAQEVASVLLEREPGSENNQ